MDLKVLKGQLVAEDRKVLKELEVVQEIVVPKVLKGVPDRKELKVIQDLLVLYVTV